jgi:hypothetical protein
VTAIEPHKCKKKKNQGIFGYIICIPAPTWKAMKDNKNVRMISESVEVNFNIIVAFVVVVVTTSVSKSLSSFNVTTTVLLLL